MRLRQLLIFALLCAPLAVRAQVGEYRSDLAIGFGGGVAMNKVSFDPTIKQNYHVGPTMGLILRYTCEKYLGMSCAVQTEVNWTSLGWKELIETSEDTYERTVNYVQIPFLARLGFGKEDRGVMGYLVLGPQIGFCIGDSEKRGGEWSEETLALRPNEVTEQYDLPIENKFEYGLTGGLGLEVNTRVGHFQLEGRYYYALSDLMDNGKTDYFSRSANGAIVVKASYLFDIFKSKRKPKNKTVESTSPVIVEPTDPVEGE